MITFLFTFFLILKGAKCENFLFDPKADVYIIRLMQTGIRLKFSDKEISKAIINKHRVYP